MKNKDEDWQRRSSWPIKNEEKRGRKTNEITWDSSLFKKTDKEDHLDDQEEKRGRKTKEMTWDSSLFKNEEKRGKKDLPYWILQESQTQKKNCID